MSEISEAAKAKACELANAVSQSAYKCRPEEIEWSYSWPKALALHIQAVSDAVGLARDEMVPTAPLTKAVMRSLAPFILPEPVDPLAEVLVFCSTYNIGQSRTRLVTHAARLREELAKRGLEIREVKP